MKTLWPIAAVVLAFAAIGLAGVLRPAPGNSAEARAAQARLDTVPMTISPWVGVVTPISPNHLKIAEAQAWLSRTYTRQSDRATFTVLILAGAPGPLGAHTPQTCFAGAGYELEAAPSAMSLSAVDGKLWLGRFTPPPSRGGSCELAWGWGDGEKWVASTDPRFEFAGRNLLYKLYVTRGIVGPGQSGPRDEFLTAFLTAFDAAG